jgi:hypothetical protein
MEPTLLREAGQFPNRSIVEYATIRVQLPNRLLPSNLHLPDIADDELISLYVSPSGRLTFKTLFLNSFELAQQFMHLLHTVFEKRPYAEEYKLEVVVTTTSMTATATKRKSKHSLLVTETLAKAENQKY